MRIKLKLISNKLDSNDEISKLVNDITLLIENAKGKNKDAYSIDKIEKRFSSAYKAKNVAVLKQLLYEAKKL